MNPSPPRRFLRSLAALADTVAARLEVSLSAGCNQLEVARTSLQASLGREIPPAECADMLSQAMVASLPLATARPEVFERAGPWLLTQATPWERLVLVEVLGLTDSGQLLSKEYSVLSTQYSVLASPHLFEHFLAEHRRLHRKRGGSFYTPDELVQFITRRVHQQLKDEFGLRDGLAEATILDPAAGTGAFLLGAMDIIHEDLGKSESWSDFVSSGLLSRLRGIEIIPAACIAAQLNIAVKLADTGFDFHQPGRIQVELGNTLQDISDFRFQISDSGKELTDSANLKSAIRNLKLPLVILGNPPFSSLSDNRGKWISDLVRGSRESPGYVITADGRLGEKKTWLHDDYVKFVRYAQWLIEQTGSGIVGFVTNHGYLDNVTFRLMRRELMRVFSRIDVVDVHGNRKKEETAPSGAPDENVFGLDQGTAVGFFRRLPGQGDDAVPTVRHGELWGTRDDKLRRLASQDAPPGVLIAPAAPHFLFTPAPPPMLVEYAVAWRLPDAMPVNTTAPVTARDHFVVAHTREELLRRIAEFRELSIPDEEIRTRYFTRTRSAKYLPGDTRSWKLPAARRIIAAEENWPSFIRRCLYRPFDWRYVFWHPAMIDWPRTGVVGRLQIADFGLPIAEPAIPQSAIGNRQSAILISRRQMLPTQPCSFFWMADTLPLDGVIRSDNRGSESLFPLYLFGPQGETEASTANFSPEFIDVVRQQTQLSWLPHSCGDLISSFGPEDVLFYIYALFHSSTYRQRYAAELRTDFPRILLPREATLLQDLVPRGERLAQWHTLRVPAPPMNGVTSDQLQQFRAGGHQPLRACRKNTESPHEHPLAPYIAATLDEMSAIDRAIERCGGWPAAFAGSRNTLNG